MGMQMGMGGDGEVTKLPKMWKGQGWAGEEMELG